MMQNKFTVGKALIYLVLVLLCGSIVVECFFNIRGLGSTMISTISFHC